MRTHEVNYSLSHLSSIAIRAVFDESIEIFEIPYDVTAIDGIELLAIELY